MKMDHRGARTGWMCRARSRAALARSGGDRGVALVDVIVGTVLIAIIFGATAILLTRDARTRVNASTINGEARRASAVVNQIRTIPSAQFSTEFLPLADTGWADAPASVDSDPGVYKTQVRIDESSIAGDASTYQVRARSCAPDVTDRCMTAFMVRGASDLDIVAPNGLGDAPVPCEGTLNSASNCIPSGLSYSLVDNPNSSFGSSDTLIRVDWTGPTDPTTFNPVLVNPLSGNAAVPMVDKDGNQATAVQDKANGNAGGASITFAFPGNSRTGTYQFTVSYTKTGRAASDPTSAPLQIVLAGG